MAVSDRLRGRGSREGFIVIAGVLVGLWFFAFAVLGMASNWAQYGF